MRISDWSSDVCSSDLGWQVRTIGSQEAMIRSGRLGLPWVGHPVAWVRPIADDMRFVPVAIGTDHAPNLARNLYLAAKMLTGVRPAVGVRAMYKLHRSDERRGGKECVRTSRSRW